ncbi:MAG: adenylate/guanylate cyclase domain-containing protein [Spirochaetes bacterium]|nr:adenylate/guanylate cyclase domain-containing protein [Spirochaetota bacterium]
MKLSKNVILGFAAALFFSLLGIAGVFSYLENRLYDLFLHFRADRQRITNVVFLNVDDAGIAFHGVFPWPRSITADALLRLKEFGALAAIFDIEYIEKGPPGVDSIYLEGGLGRDFDRSFTEITSATGDLISAILEGRLNHADIDMHSHELIAFIRQERDNLYKRARTVARDNDLYLAQASALLGRSWATLNLRPHPLDNPEEAARRPMAEELFSRPINARPGANPGEFVDILPALPLFAMSAQGAGFTNAVIDSDGVRRRIYLALNVKDHWYFQLAFAPLMYYLGNPEVELHSRRMIIRDARLGDRKRDIVIPLDNRGRMLLDWPRGNFFEKYKHISFYDFALLELLEAELEQFSVAFLYTDIPFFAQHDSSLASIPFIAHELMVLFNAARALRIAALENTCEESFFEYLEHRAYSRDLIREILELNPGAKVKEIADALTGEGGAITDSGTIAAILYEAEYINNLAKRLETVLSEYYGIRGVIKNAVQGRFCIIGRVDTGTTDIGRNPFHRVYINTGTHAVVLDTILSESFLRPAGIFWRILLTLTLAPLLIIAGSFLSPKFRAGSGFLGALLIFICAALIFRFTGLYLPPIEIIFAIITAVVGREIFAYIVSEKERKFYRQAFATYTSEAVANEIAKNPSLLQLGGTKRQMSAVFTDINNFSGIAETLTPEELVSLLNQYLTLMSDIILNEQGTIDKYVGDAIIAFFSAPLEQSSHALNACITAIKIKRAEAELNKTIGQNMLLRTRIGINTGDMVAGNMGTKKKMNYTIMGDAVNLAARLESVNKQYHTWIMASEDTIKQTGDHLLVRRLDKVQVTGRNEPVQLYNVLGILQEASLEQKKLVEMFQQALDYFENRDWKRAEKGFWEVLMSEASGPAKLYLKRCEEYIKTPPDDNWDGVYKLTEK